MPEELETVVAAETPSEPEIQTEETVEVPVEAGTEEETVKDELEDLDFGYEKYRVEPKLKSAVENWRASMTRKEQEVAQLRTALESDRQTAQQASEEELDARADLK